MFPQFETRRSRKIEAVPVARAIIYVFDERPKTYPKIPELITNLRTTSRGKRCNLSGLFVVALHLRASDPMQNPRARRVPPYISLGR